VTSNALKGTRKRRHSRGKRQDIEEEGEAEHPEGKSEKSWFV
jgi:hypothetical protein